MSSEIGMPEMPARIGDPSAREQAAIEWPAVLAAFFRRNCRMCSATPAALRPAAGAGNRNVQSTVRTGSHVSEDI